MARITPGTRIRITADTFGRWTGELGTVEDRPAEFRYHEKRAAVWVFLDAQQADHDANTQYTRPLPVGLDDDDEYELVTEPRSIVTPHPATQPGFGSSRTWERVIAGRRYSFTAVLMPSGERRYAASKHIRGDGRFGSDWRRVGFWTVAA